MNLIVLLDYKGRFESKYTATPYRSGMDLELLKSRFKDLGIKVKFQYFSDLDFKKLEDSTYLYSSYEDKNGLYKSYIEDVVYGLTINQKKLIPEYKYLKAHNNKVFMEILRDSLFKIEENDLESKHFGTLQDFLNFKKPIEYPVVSKPAAGSKSKGVSLSKNLNELLNNLKKISRNFELKNYLHDKIRTRRHQKYISNSFHKHKFIIQKYIPNVQGDWKILIYGKRFYTLFRESRDNDFRASGSGKLIFKEDINERILDFAEEIKSKLNTPIVSLDIAFIEGVCYLLEFQVLYFGTYTIEYSSLFYEKINKLWVIKREKSELEKVYADAIYDFLLESNK